ncbi:uncharacterized protein LOC120517492 [Polypterus senegalus]|uniref:uncharacterized protein LOC120517492 n=1 Tax=Polypterus senegalus TaxID=55291 RepID=UPI0019668025|nr:uncharacterized protein LOC120517492 [Polypterus senegalus]XP_039595783.1 uncharacterized protein LOC120517492 [Polypterus senegalus]XP_039595784.1 uncharacterized protein LOC120517492 [Polypterus senegalus]
MFICSALRNSRMRQTNTMGSINICGTFFWIKIVQFVTQPMNSSSEDFVQIKCNNSTNVRYGEHFMLSCSAEFYQKISDVDVTVQWRFENNSPWNASKSKANNISFKISNATFTHQGTYELAVQPMNMSAYRRKINVAVLASMTVHCSEDPVKISSNTCIANISADANHTLKIYNINWKSLEKNGTIKWDKTFTNFQQEKLPLNDLRNVHENIYYLEVNTSSGIFNATTGNRAGSLKNGKNERNNFALFQALLLFHGVVIILHNFP